MYYTKEVFKKFTKTSVVKIFVNMNAQFSVVESVFRELMDCSINFTLLPLLIIEGLIKWNQGRMMGEGCFGSSLL